MHLLTAGAGVERSVSGHPIGAGESARPKREDQDQPQPETPVETRRLLLARAIIRLLSAAIGDGANLRIDLFDGSTGVPVMGERPRATLRLHGPDAVARIVWAPTPDSNAQPHPTLREDGGGGGANG